MNEDNRGLRGRMARQGEEALGKVAQELLENPMVSRALSATFEARERATRAQELAMSALNLPSAGDLERLTRRLRSVSQRLETIEDGLDRLEQRIDQLGSSSAIDRRLAAIEELLARLEAGIAEPAAMPAAVAAETPSPRRTRQSGARTAGRSGAGQESAPGRESGAGQEPGPGQKSGAGQG